MTFGLVYADPPWRYDHSRSRSRKVENHYPTMTTEDICALGSRLQSLLEKHCILFLWATAPKLLEALRVMEAWGFTYKTQGIWNKITPGMGYWFRGVHEILIVATRGKPSPPPTQFRFPSIFESRRTKHSAKPKGIANWIDLAFPDTTKLELFARETREGWASWGNEVPSIDL